MKIPDVKQMRDWDAFTIKKEKISSLELMERAAEQCTNRIAKQYRQQKQIHIFCGKGNNGGDGLAMARQLKEKNFEPTVYIADFDEKESDDFVKNLDRLQKTGIDIVFLKTEQQFPQLQNDSLVIEALLGFGLNRKAEGNFALLINHINNQQANIISIDVPAGMFTDKSSKGNVMIQATETLTFQTMKLCFLMAENAAFFGDVHILPIGLDKEYEQSLNTKFVFMDELLAASFYKPRQKFSHKGTYGHALLIAGNEGKMGAAVMCATSCLRSGVGLLTCSIPKNDFSILHISIPEAMIIERGKEKDIDHFTVVGLGPGLGKEEATALLIHSVLQQYKKPMVIDADGLNILSQYKDWLNDLPENSVLTPHPKEFERLFGECDNDFERMNKAIEMAGKHKVIIVLKGTFTLITDGKRNYYNSTGNNGMATGGSGDILTGIVTGLLAQQYKPFEAAVTAVYIHGLAADLCLDEQSFESLLPMDIVSHFGKAFLQLQKNKGA